MPRWLLLLFAGLAAFFLAFVFSDQAFALLLLLAGSVLVVVAILFRPREIAAADDARLFARAGEGWGAGIGPVPGEIGPVVPPEGMPYALTRSYHARSKETLERLRLTDANLLAPRGYVPTSSQYLEGRWRGVDWFAAIVFLVLFFIVGIIAIIYLIATKPTGTLTVTYERKAPAAGWQPQGQAPVAPVTGAPPPPPTPSWG